MNINWQEWKQQREGFDPENDDPADRPDDNRPSMGKPKKMGTSTHDAAARWLKKNTPAKSTTTTTPEQDQAHKERLEKFMADSKKRASQLP